jgi:precorrin-2 dehydrogenase / sirohydrochlorin ferrochelatase
VSRPYAAFLRLAGRRCVVVGGGAVAERKVGTLVDCGANVVVIAPTATDRIVQAAAEGRLVLTRRPYRAGDLDGAFLAVAATDERAVNAQVVAYARALGILVNSVDEREPGDLIVPATVQRGDIVVAVSTGGRSPSFARYLREELEAWLTPERVELFELLADVRSELQAAGRNPDPELWRQAVDVDLVRELAAGDHSAARQRLLLALDPATLAAGSTADPR